MKNSLLKLPIRHFSPPRAPPGLGKPGRKLWREIQRQYAIEDSGGLAHLTSTCQAADDLARMRGVVERDGDTLLDRFGQVIGHPLLLAIARTESVKRLALAALCLDVEPLKDRVGRPSGK